MDSSAIRSRLAGTGGRPYWRSLGELAGTPEFREYLHREFPAQASEWNDPKGRRQFLKLMSASLALAGVGACTKQPPEAIVPYVKQPEDLVPGRPLFFASAIPLSGVAAPVLVESHMGRPTKVEGNPDHPASLGATDALAQAAILGLYDPDRSHSCLRAGQIGTWSAFATELGVRLEGIGAHQGEGLGVLFAGEASPFLAAQLGRLQARYPKMRVYRWTPLHRDHSRAGAELAFGRDVSTRYRLDKARVVVALESDFLGGGPGAVRYARDFAAGR